MSTTDFVLALVVVIVMVQSFLLLLLYRQVGVLLLGRRERKRQGPAVGSILSREARYSLGLAPHDTDDRPILYLFARKGCRACRDLLQTLPNWLAEARLRARVVVLGDGPADLTTVERQRLSSSGVAQTENIAAFEALDIGVTPFGLLLDPGGRVLSKGIVSRPIDLRLKGFSEVAEAGDRL